MSAKRTNPDFLNGVPELLTLRLLSRRPMYGYELVEMIRMTSGEVFEFGEGCIYPLLHRLEADGYLTSERKTVQGRSRVIYSITKPGLERLRDSAEDWLKISRTIRGILEGANYVEHTLDF